MIASHDSGRRRSDQMSNLKLLLNSMSGKFHTSGVNKI